MRARTVFSPFAARCAAPRKANRVSCTPVRALVPALCEHGKKYGSDLPLCLSCKVLKSQGNPSFFVMQTRYGVVSGSFGHEKGRGDEGDTPALSPRPPRALSCAATPYSDACAMASSIKERTSSMPMPSSDDVATTTASPEAESCLTSLAI